MLSRCRSAVWLPLNTQLADSRLGQDQSDHHNIVVFLKDNKAEFHTYYPNTDQNVRCVRRNLPPSTDFSEVIARLSEKGVETSHALQIKSNALVDGVRFVTFLHLCIISVLKSAENIYPLKNITGIPKFVCS